MAIARFLDSGHCVRAGDTVIVHSMDRLTRNLDDLRATVRMLTAKGRQFDTLIAAGAGHP